MVLLQIDIPLTLVLIGFGVVIVILWVAWLTYHFRRMLKMVKAFMGNVPILSPSDLNDLEARARAIDAFNSGDKGALEKYWSDIYAKGKEEKEDE